MPKRSIPIYKDNLFLVGIQFFVLAVFMSIFFFEDVFSNQYFSFGPNENVELFGIRINTWKLWGAMVIIRVISVFTKTAVGSIVSPWIHTVFQARTVPLNKIGCSLSRAILVINLYEIAGSINSIFEIWIIFTQVDLALIESAACLLVLNVWTIPRWLEEKEAFAKSDMPESLDGRIEVFKQSLLKEISATHTLTEELRSDLDKRLEKFKSEITSELLHNRRISVLE